VTAGEGYVYLVDRRVDVIVTGGANVYPAEVESGLVADRGGVAAARRAMENPSSRTALLSGLNEIITSLDPGHGVTEGLAAAEVCRGSGRGLLPVPVEAMLLRRTASARWWRSHLAGGSSTVTSFLPGK
jgi:acyl-CoA synthetase (AMP-forming)/AMP-acid ligase II